MKVKPSWPETLGAGRDGIRGAEDAGGSRQVARHLEDFCECCKVGQCMLHLMAFACCDGGVNMDGRGMRNCRSHGDAGRAGDGRDGGQSREGGVRRGSKQMAGSGMLAGWVMHRCKSCADSAQAPATSRQRSEWLVLRVVRRWHWHCVEAAKCSSVRASSESFGFRPAGPVGRGDDRLKSEGKAGGIQQMSWGMVDWGKAAEGLGLTKS